MAEDAVSVVGAVYRYVAVAEGLTGNDVFLDCFEAYCWGLGRGGVLGYAVGGGLVDYFNAWGCIRWVLWWVQGLEDGSICG